MFKALIASTIGTFFIFICQLLIVPFLFVFGFNTAVVRPVNPPIEATPTLIPIVTSTANSFELTATQLISDATATIIALTPTDEASESNNLFGDRSTPQSETPELTTTPEPSDSSDNEDDASSNLFGDRSTPQSETPEPTATPEPSDSSDNEDDDGSTNLFDERATQQSDD